LAAGDIGIAAERIEPTTRSARPLRFHGGNGQSEPEPTDRHQMVERVRRKPRIGPAIDRSLIDRARNGDLDAFETIVRARMEAVFRLTTAILGDEADAHDAPRRRS
jgi:hypothetical protein